MSAGELGPYGYVSGACRRAKLSSRQDLLRNISKQPLQTITHIGVTFVMLPLTATTKSDQHLQCWKPAKPT
eukprot:6474156-Amphidinium_carterae.1